MTSRRPAALLLAESAEWPCVAADVHGGAKLRFHACLLAARVRPSRRSRLLLRATGHPHERKGVAQRLPSCPAELSSPPSPFGLPWMAQLTGAAFQSRARASSCRATAKRLSALSRRGHPKAACVASSQTRTPVEASVPCRGCPRPCTESDARPCRRGFAGSGPPSSRRLVRPHLSAGGNARAATYCLCPIRSEPLALHVDRC